MSGMVRIQPMREADIPALVALEQKCFAHPWCAQGFAEELQNPTARFLVASVGEQVAGYIGANHICGEVYIANVAVDPSCRRRGIALALLERLAEISVAENAVFLTLEVRVGNVGALALYDKCGFKNMGVRPHFYSDPDEDAYILTKEL